jgi:hypothetical protein
MLELDKSFVQNTNCDPPPTSFAVEEKTLNSRKNLKQLKIKNIKNFTPLQTKTLKALQDNTNYIIKPSDKSLGPAILDTNEYISLVLNEHLLSKNYQQLSVLEAKTIIEDI